MDHDISASPSKKPTHPPPTVTQVRAAARRLLAMDCQPVRVLVGTKRPRDDNWQDLRLTDADIDGRFTDGYQLGVMNGEPSGWRVDVDLDCKEALDLADKFLPPTGAITGRPTRPRSHRWYIAVGTVNKHFRDPVTGEMIVELRGTGLQTVVGPSIHPDDQEPYDMLEGEPAVVDAGDLAARVAALHEAVVLARYGNLAATLKRGPFLGEPAVAPANRSVTPPDDAKTLRRASRYLATMPPGIAGQNGHGRTYAAAVCMVHGFGLDAQAAYGLLWNEYNPRCEPPWSEREIQHKVEDAVTKPHMRPYGWLRDASLPSPSPPSRTPPSRGASAQGTVHSAGHSAVPVANNASTRCPNARNDILTAAVGDAAATITGDLPPVAEGPIPLGHSDPESGRLVLSPKKTLPTATAFIEEYHRKCGSQTLYSYGGSFLRWVHNHYTPEEDGHLRHVLQPWLHNALRYVVNQRTGVAELRNFESNPLTVGQALDTIRGLVHLPAATSPPCWLGNPAGRPSAQELLSCRSFNLHIPTGEVVPATADLFTFNALEFDHDPNAPAPERWMEYLRECFADDAESIRLFQEWFGYCLTPDTRQQKALLMVGPRRSGKGTAGRVLKRLVGASNFAAPTSDSLAEHFGLQPLIGKSVAAISDARFRSEKASTIVERILSITGEDTMTIDRKYKDPLTTKLSARLVFMTNELPRLVDVGGALAGRFMVLRFTQSFYGREDTSLEAKLGAELPGILNWAIEGWRSLNARGYFVQPASSHDVVQQLADLCSPVGAFVREECEVEPFARVGVDDLFSRWCAWCKQNGGQEPGIVQTFGRDLGAVVPTMLVRRGTKDERFYQGVGLKQR